MGRRTERMAGTRPARTPTRTVTTKAPARTRGVEGERGRGARERGIEDEGAQPREEREVREEPGGSAEDGEEGALREEEPEDRPLREADRAQDGELRTRSRAAIAIVFAAMRRTTAAMTAVRLRMKSFTFPMSAR